MLMQFMNGFFNNAIDVLPWSARSPDLNPIENFWGIIVRDVYAKLRQFEYEDDLREAILNAWDNISEETIANLVFSMRDRCSTLSEKLGGPTRW